MSNRNTLANKAKRREERKRRHEYTERYQAAMVIYGLIAVAQNREPRMTFNREMARGNKNRHRRTH